MIHGIGTDLCEITRMKKALENPRFAARILTDAELARLNDMAPERRAEFLAGRFAAKEAVAKALGTGISGFGFSDIEILPDDAGRPLVLLHGGAKALTDGKNTRIHLSISHDGGMALAFAVIEII